MLKNPLRLLASALALACSTAQAMPPPPAPDATAPLSRAQLAGRDAAQTPETLALAHDYMRSRPAIFVRDPIPAQAALGPQQEAIEAMLDQMLKLGNGSPTWTRNDPRRQQMVALMLRDVASLAAEQQAAAQSADTSKRVSDAFAHGLAARLDNEQLSDLANYYASPQGREFSTLQGKLFMKIATGMVALQRQNANRQAPPARVPKPDHAELVKLLGLTEEIAGITLAMADPGPGKDRSGLQALPMIMAMSAEANFGELAALWDGLPPRLQDAIVAWRQAPLAKAEREALYHAAGELRNVYDVNAEMEKSQASMIKLQEKWRVELQRQLP